jgi:simple sugar transport system ATP-binding protein
MSAYIEMRNISKRFDTVLANDGVSLDVNRGEIVALLGENGSGKSTLVNMLSGLYTPDSGEIVIDGRQRAFASPRQAIDAGVGMVHQHFMLIPVMSAFENIVLGDRGRGHGKNAAEKLAEIEKRYGLAIDRDKKIRDLSIGEKQSVEILKMLYRGAQSLILDEPTAVLTPQESGRLFVMLRTMRAAGCAIIIITHKLNEVMEISDRVTVLRKGRMVGTVETAATSARELTTMMVGAPISLEIERVPPPVAAGTKPVLEVRGLRVRDREGVAVINDVSFDISGGEILGVAGIAGSGQKELCEAITGLCHAESGSIRFLGGELRGLSPRVIKKKGVQMNFTPEDRLGMGLVAGMSIVDNVLLKSYDSGGGPFVDRERGRTQSEKIVSRYAVSTPSIHHVVKKLSGGNIQKVLLGRELEMGPRLLITAYPVRGLDIGSSYSVYAMLNAQKAAGVAVLYIGEDIDVLRELCDRLLVIHRGEVMGIIDPREASKEDIGLLMLGQRDNAATGVAA